RQERVNGEVGKQWARDAALRRASRVALATTDAPGPVAVIPFLDRRFQPQLDQPQHAPVHNATSYRFQKLVMWNRIEVAGQIGVDHVGVAPAYQPAHFFDRVHRSAGGGGAGRHNPQVPPRILVPAGVGRRLPPPVPGWSDCRAVAPRPRVLRSPPAALGQADTSSRLVPRAGPLATPPSPTL